MPARRSSAAIPWYMSTTVRAAPIASLTRGTPRRYEPARAAARSVRRTSIPCNIPDRAEDALESSRDEIVEVDHADHLVAVPVEHRQQEERLLAVLHELEGARGLLVGERVARPPVHHVDERHREEVAAVLEDPAHVVIADEAEEPPLVVHAGRGAHALARHLEQHRARRRAHVDHRILGAA